MEIFAKSVLIFSIFLLPTFGFADCILPAPDGDELEPSPPNIEGKIVSIRKNSISIQAFHPKKVVKVVITSEEPIYTVYGGMQEITGTRGLEVNQFIKVWLVNCTKNKNISTAAYLQVEKSALGR